MRHRSRPRPLGWAPGAVSAGSRIEHDLNCPQAARASSWHKRARSTERELFVLKSRRGARLSFGGAARNVRQLHLREQETALTSISCLVQPRLQPQSETCRRSPKTDVKRVREPHRKRREISSTEALRTLTFKAI